MGRALVVASDPGPFVALVDLGRAVRSPRAWVVPSGEARGRLDRSGEGRPYRYRASAEELAPREEDWDAVEERLLAGRSSPYGLDYQGGARGSIRGGVCRGAGR